MSKKPIPNPTARDRAAAIVPSPAADNVSGHAVAGPDGRWMVAAALALVGGMLWAGLVLGQPTRVWAAAGVPTMGTGFADLYPFPAAQQTLEQGGDIYTPMPVERWGRSFNYPVLWLSFMRFPESAIPYVGSAMIVVWFAALWAACGRLSLLQGALLGAAVCSPVTILAMERGNTDLVIFCLVAAALVALRRGKNALAWSAFVVAATLKLFPVFALFSFLRLGWRRAWPWVLSGIAAFVIVCVIQSEEIRGVLRETPKAAGLSYGAVVWLNRLNYLFQFWTGVKGIFDPYLLPTTASAVILVGTCFVAGARLKPVEPGSHDTGASLDAFRTGAAIFIATFAVGSHYVYRLLFLLLCVPWLAHRQPTTDAVSRTRRFAALLLVGAFWANPLVWEPLHYVREAATWGLACLLGWLLGRTLPVGSFLDRWRILGRQQPAEAAAPVAADVERQGAGAPG